MSSIIYDEDKHNRDQRGRFDEKPQSAPEAVLRSGAVTADGTFSGGIQQELFPVDWVDEDFPAPPDGADEDAAPVFDDPDEALAAEYFSQPEPDFDAIHESDINLLDKATWGATPF